MNEQTQGSNNAAMVVIILLGVGWFVGPELAAGLAVLAVALVIGLSLIHAVIVGLCGK